MVAAEQVDSVIATQDLRNAEVTDVRSGHEPPAEEEHGAIVDDQQDLLDADPAGLTDIHRHARQLRL